MNRIKQDLGLATTTLSTRVLDTVSGRPAAGLHLKVTTGEGDETTVVSGRTDAEGRAQVPDNVDPGPATIVFETGPWFGAQGRTTCYPEIEIRITLTVGEHHHVDLSVSPFAYSTSVSTHLDS